LTNTPTASRTATATATPTLTSTGTAVPLATATPTPTQGAAPTPQVSGTPGVECATAVGDTCQVTGTANGTWTKTSSGVFPIAATGPAGALVGATPTIFIPTSANRNGEAFACTPTSAALTTTCGGATVGDALCNVIVTVDFPLAAGGFGAATGAIACAPAVV